MSQTRLNFAILPGDGAGPELAEQLCRIIQKISEIRKNIIIQVKTRSFGASSIKLHGEALPEETLKTCSEADAVFLCGCGDSNYGTESEKALLSLRKKLGVYANIRPIRFPSTKLVSNSSFKAKVVEDVNITFVRDLTGGVYYGRRHETETTAYDTTEYNHETIKRLARWAGEFAIQSKPPKPVFSVDKYNVMATSRLWKRVVARVFEDEFPDVPLHHVLVDHAAMLLSSNPTHLNGVILTENLFGDILSDQAGAIVGSQDVLGSAGISCLPGRPQSGKPGLFEAVNLKTQNAKGLKTINPLGVIAALQLALETSLGLEAEAHALESAVRKTLDPYESIGSDIQTRDIGGSASTAEFVDKLLENLEFFLEAANSNDYAAEPPSALLPGLAEAPRTQRQLGIVEKILLHSAVGLTRPDIKPGDMICVKVDWVLTSELLWGGMEKTYEQMKRPRVFRNDRVWLALDHTIDPRTSHLPKQQKLIKRAERFRQEAKIIDFLPENTSIMHTDFTRDRAQPGYVVVGSDSHTCSAGSMGAFAVGFGAADVVMPMVTGETWFRVPEVCNIHFVGKLPFGISGKDVILYVLGELKRNTIAFQRAVEYTGPGLTELSMDARFAIANMTTEFGGVGACFEADGVTAAWIAKRKIKQHRDRGLYFRADPQAQYAERRVIDLSRVESTIALYPNPDDVVPISARQGMKLDGCFIGACTTTEEDLILAALLLEAGLKLGLRPVAVGKRRVTPGSLIITSKLREEGLLSVYDQAGFEVGAPGCSYCVGINDVDVAGKDEVWLSSQNRNFRNRMGAGSFGNITSAAAVAASSFDMTVTDPTYLLNKIDSSKYSRLIKSWKEEKLPDLKIVEPSPRLSDYTSSALLIDDESPNDESDTLSRRPRIKGNVQRFEYNVDTDAIIPAEFMPGVDNADLGSHCFQYFRPEFRQKARAGSTIIVARGGFGSGSSREDAVRALQGSGIKAVIAESFAFIYERNQLNMGLFNIKIRDDSFYEHAVEDSIIVIDQDRKVVLIEGIDKEYKYDISKLEEALLDAGGVLPMYQKHDKSLFRHLVVGGNSHLKRKAALESAPDSTGCATGESRLVW